MHRLFVALRPPPAIREKLLAIMADIPGARWQDDDQLHLTLRFIGAVERPVAEDVAAALGGVNGAVPTVRLAGVGAFAHRDRIDTLWAGVAPRDDLALLHAKVDRACVCAGLPPERRAYLPHVTLARLPRSLGEGAAIERWRATHAALSSEPFAMTHLMLYESDLGRDGAQYEPVARRPLGTGGDMLGS